MWKIKLNHGDVTLKLCDSHIECMENIICYLHSPILATAGHSTGGTYGTSMAKIYGLATIVQSNHFFQIRKRLERLKKTRKLLSEGNLQKPLLKQSQILVHSIWNTHLVLTLLRRKNLPRLHFSFNLHRNHAE